MSSYHKSRGDYFRKINQIHGNNQVYMGGSVVRRLNEGFYKGHTMRIVVNMLHRFTQEYESSPEDRNTRYGVYFIFHWRGRRIPGPMCAVIDVTTNQCVRVWYWNKYTLKAISEYNQSILERAWRDKFAQFAKQMRLRYNLPNRVLWGRLSRNIVKIRLFRMNLHEMFHKYDLSWEEIDPSGTLSPICGTDGVYASQIANLLKVTMLDLVQWQEASDKDVVVDGRIGILRVKSPEVFRSVDGAVWDGNRLVVPLMNGGELRLARTGYHYFYSTVATAWMIDTIRNCARYADMMEKKAALPLRRNLGPIEARMERYNLTWDQIDPSGQLSPIKWINAVSQKQLAAFLGTTIEELQKCRIKARKDLDFLGAYSASAKTIARRTRVSKRNEDKTFDIPLKNGGTMRIIHGMGMYYPAPAAVRMIEEFRYRQGLPNRTK